MQVVLSGLPVSFFTWLWFWSGDRNSHVPSFVTVAYSSLLHLVWRDLVFHLFVARVVLCPFWLWVFMGPSLSSIQACRSLPSSVFHFVLLGLLFAGCCDFLSLLCVRKSLKASGSAGPGFGFWAVVPVLGLFGCSFGFGELLVLEGIVCIRRCLG